MAVIVDGYSSGNLLAPEFSSRGISCIHVASDPQAHARRSGTFRREDYLLSDIDHHGSARLRSFLDAHGLELVAVIPGTETGVRAADRIAYELGHPARNGHETSDNRRDKLRMLSRAAECGVRTLPTVGGTNADAIIDEYVDRKLGWPAVAKPAASAGTDGVALCSGPQELHRALKGILLAKNKLSTTNVTALAQPYAAGQEFVVDTVTWNGNHRVVDLWHTRKGRHNGSDFVCESTDSCALDAPQGRALCEFAYRVLDALGVVYGAGHTEIILSDEGPVLVECAARLHGAGFPRFAREIWGSSQASCLAQMYDESTSPTTARREGVLRIVELISARGGRIDARPGAVEIRSLPSYWADTLPEIGDHITRTVDVFTSPGAVVLFALDPAVVERDYRAIREIEVGLFELSPDGP
ncbi:ATP-grasp domain-containing protein [Sorangium sp. So ce341]|uniref:ATP-grasp domain-containing protein n=1 Tax=Sorangium sp. So ce341 TaxID=3133302 RepID=UPI003F63CFC8